MPQHPRCWDYSGVGWGRSFDPVLCLDACLLPQPCYPGSSEEVGLVRSTNGVLCFLSPQLGASLQPRRFKSCNSWSQHGQQHRQPSPQGQRVQPPPQPGANSELTVRAGPSLLPGPVTDHCLVCSCPQTNWAASPRPFLHHSFLSSRGLLDTGSCS